jgi:hypothetical protein
MHRRCTNSQPWCFSEEECEISVHADAARRLDVAEPIPPAARF